MSLEEALKKLGKTLSQDNSQDSSSIDLDLTHPCAICGKDPFCGGLGVVRYDLPPEHPLFGKLVRCPNNPQETDPQWQERMRKFSNLETFKDQTFERFLILEEEHTVSEQESLNHALQTTYRYAQNPQGWVLLQGAYGCGKTHLAAAIANERLAQGEKALFVTVPDLLDHLRATYAPTSEVTYDTLFDSIKNAPLLILDDLGSENPSPWAQEKLFQLFNHRYVGKLPTVVTTNHDLDEIDPRIRSRTLDGDLVTHIHIYSRDYRTEIAKAGNSAQLDTNLKDYAKYRFDNFVISKNVTPEEKKNLDNALRITKSYATEQFEGWLVLMGEHGTGKTHLAAAIANQRQDMGTQVMFITAPDLLDYLRVTFNPNSTSSFDKRFSAVKNTEFLIIDNLDTTNATSWAREKLFQIIDYRYIRALPTVITTAVPLEKLDKGISIRLVDRRLCFPLALLVRPYALRF